MTRGTLEVLLVSAKGLDNSDFLSKSDPYAVITYRTQEKTSGIASVQGSSSEWNESFLFSISSDGTDLKIKLMDKDTFTADDFMGEATIPLQPLFVENNVPPMAYHVVKEDKYCGQIRVGLTFTPQRSRGLEEESYGGWKESSCVE
ncbi:hypothetical protein SASPL_102516 [Salvia splendens]|uniref:C2 domain-containing protein n=1 Tax=Salvia splendens TaxID=180675 RepID=A0A8X9AC79_SALSN|nr:elicitor-responsive protein 3-like [Salvia splendens]KAG6437597.1 hypothetical protein SASPL_102516 [Salvia splendens]